MAAPEEISADMLAFWNGKGGDTWVARQEHTDITLAPVTDALLVPCKEITDTTSAKGEIEVVRRLSAVRALVD